ncbi:MAG: leucine-rich repeat domain-containing protein [Promethearchaeota archaeon]|nr:MAG: leucine-rich repeat domain-containing protein [Candidatus Lokiarchaeota archaeon]
MMDLTPEEISKGFKNKKINKITTYNLLTSLIENSENEDIRLESIIRLEEINIINNELFSFLENLLISDSERKIRINATKFLTNKFLEKAINPLKWAIKHETDFECLITISQSLAKINNNESNLILINEIKKIIKTKYLNKERKIENKKFRKVLKKLFKSKNIANFSQEELAEVLINYLVISNLINQYPNVYYELDPQIGVVTELDLSDYMEYEVKGTPFGWKNRIISISEIKGLKYLNFLKKIDLSNNQIENVHELVKFGNLTHLILANNKINELKNLEYIRKLPNLEYLDLRRNNIVNKIDLNEFNSRMRVLLKDSFLH